MADTPQGSAAPPSPREKYLAIGLLVVALALFFWPLATDDAPYYRDLLRTYYPIRSFMAERLRAGSLPQWYPYENLGEPFIGQVVPGVFHPITLLYVIFPLIAAVKAELLTCYALALAGTYLLARALGSSRAASTAGALVMALGGYSLAMSNNPPYLRGVATLPWLAWAIIRCCRSKTPWRWVPGIGLAWAALVLGGDAQAYLLGGAVAVAALGAEKQWRRLPAVVVGGALSLGFSAVELVPALHVRDESIRSGAASAALGREWALHPGRLPELILDGYIPDQFRGWLVQFHYGGGTALWASSIFLGSLAVGLALMGGLSRESRRNAWLALAAFGIWLALGAYGGLHTALRTVIPLLNSFRFPEKNLVIAQLGIAVCAALGIDQLMNDAKLRSRATIGAFACGAALLIAAAVLRFTGLEQFAMSSGGKLPLPPELVELVRHVRGQAALTAGAFLLIGGLVVSRLGDAPRSWALCALVLAQLYLGNGNQLPLIPREILTRQSKLCSAATRAGAGVGHGRLFPQARRGPPSTVTLNDGALWSSAMLNLMEPDTSGLCGIETLGYNLPALPKRDRILLGYNAAEAEPFLPLFNTPFITYDGPPRAAREQVLDTLDQLGYVLAVRPSLPRAFAAPARWMHTSDEVLAELRKNPLSGTEAVLLEGSGPPLDGAVPTDAVRVTEYAPESVTLDADLPHPAAVVLNDAFYPGWTATVDGNPAPIVAANYLARAVVVDAGKHRVVFSYRLVGLGAGEVISLASFALAALIFAGAYFRSRREKIASPSARNATT